MPRLFLLLAIICLPLASFANDFSAIRSQVERAFPNIHIEQIQASAVPQWLEVQADGDIFYSTIDGHFLFYGDLININDARQNLTEQRRADLRIQALQQERRILTFAPETIRHTVKVFTDIDCGYCQKFHHDMQDYHERGIAVEYYFFPRAGLNSPSYQKAVSVWCHEDPHDAMTRAVSKQAIPTRTCENPIEDHLRLGQRIGVQGTPALVLEDGTVLPGYLPAHKLEAILEQAKQNSR